MDQVVAFWHYIAALGLFGLMGLAAHICRALFRPVADPSLPRSFRDFAGAGGSPGAWPFESEADAAGHYRLASLRNLRNAACLSSSFGIGVMIVSPDAAAVIARFIDVTAASIGQIF